MLIKPLVLGGDKGAGDMRWQLVNRNRAAITRPANRNRLALSVDKFDSGLAIGVPQRRGLGQVGHAPI